MTDNTENQQTIRPVQSDEERMICAGLMADSEPWITLKRSLKDTKKAVLDSSVDIFISTKNNEITGFIIIQMNGAFRGYIQSFGIMPGWRGNGVGTQLLNFAEEYIFDKTPNVFLCVSSFNKDAKRFYANHGYETVGELKNYVLEGYSEILMRKTTAPLSDYKV